MANTYTWSFPTLTAYPTYESQTDVVYTVHWVLNGTDGNGHKSTGNSFIIRNTGAYKWLILTHGHFRP